MRKGLSAIGVTCLFLLFLNGHAYSSVHTHKKISKKHHSSVMTAALLPMSPDQTVTAREKTLPLRASKGARKFPMPVEGSAPVIEQSTDRADGDEYVEYKVKRGDTIEKLVKKFNVDKEEFKDLNETTKKRLTPGRIVFIPKVQGEPEEAPTVLPDRPLRPWKNEDERSLLVKVATTFAGAPYRFGGDTVRGLDCSAFVRKMYEIFEVQLPRCAREQFYAGPKVGKDDLATGDLVFFKTERYATYPTHVGIYIGDGTFIHASSSLPGKGVRVDHLSDAYFARTYAGAVRVKGPPGAGNTDAN